MQVIPGKLNATVTVFEWILIKKERKKVEELMKYPSCIILYPTVSYHIVRKKEKKERNMHVIFCLSQRSRKWVIIKEPSTHFTEHICDMTFEKTVEQKEKTVKCSPVKWRIWKSFLKG